ncbi:hypothetical protein KVV02_002985 [Mortierella alpina]|uniref:W2 domain-containing protein n=1 Tax=Mortierella alpina TaxID=64518 RepID=A0A9P8CY93_MORAP|nr:hypothetical protein KVV02_002985 [Mortierella alpina]
MCSLYSINNTKFAGQSSFQVVLCAKGSDSQHSSSSSSSSSCPPSAWSSCPSSPSCSYKRKKMKGGVLLSSTTPRQHREHPKHPQQEHQQQQQQGDLASTYSQSQLNALHYPPLGHIVPYHQQQQNRRRHSSNNSSRTAHWHQFHHDHLDSLDSFLPHETMELAHRHQPHSYTQKRSSWSNNHRFASSSSSSSINSSHGQRALASPASCRDAGNRMSLPILDHTDSTHNRMQVHSKTVSHACATPAILPASPYPQQPRLHHHSHARTASDRSRTADPMVISFAAAAAAAVSSTSSTGAATSSSLPRSALATFFSSKESPSVSLGPVAGGTEADSSRSQKTMEDADVASPLGSSVESSSHVAFDGDVMDLHRQASDPNDSDASMVEADMTKDYHEPSTATEAIRSAQNNSAVFADAIPLERKSRLRRKIERLQAKNKALTSSMHQAKSDLALERQQRKKVDQIYLKIRTDLNQKLEAEEIKALNLKAEMEQMASDMKELKDRLTGTKSQSSLAPCKSTSSMGKSPSSSGYRIGYDSNAFALSSGFSNIGGLVLYPQTRCNVDLIGGQDDAEEFLFSHSYSATTARSARSLSSSTPTIAESKRNMSYSEDDEDEDEDEDDEDEDNDAMNEDSSDNEDGRDDISALSRLTQRCRRPTAPPTSRRASVASATSLPTLVEEEDDEGEEMEDSNNATSHSEDESEVDNAPRTMMEIIMERERSRTPEDDLEDQPADANESFESMAQTLLNHAIHSRFTVAQVHLQLEEIALKYDAQPQESIDVIAKEVLRWWEAERLCLGGPLAGGWGTEPVVINQETGEQAGPRVAVEKKVELFFGPLLLQYVASLPEQMLLLEKLALYATADARWLRNHNAVLVALYKYDVLEAEAVLEWWQGLEEPQGVFGHGGNNLRSLNAKFAAWLEDDDEDSESEGEDEDEEESGSDEESEIWSEEDDGDEDEDTEMDQDGVVESMLEMAFPTLASSGKETTENYDRSPAASGLVPSSTEPKRRISFCTNTMYYSPDGTAFEGDALFANKDRESKKYVQCPPLKSSVGIDEDDVDAALNEVSVGC